MTRNTLIDTQINHMSVLKHRAFKCTFWFSVQKQNPEGMYVFLSWSEFYSHISFSRLTLVRCILILCGQLVGPYPKENMTHLAPPMQNTASRINIVKRIGLRALTALQSCRKQRIAREECCWTWTAVPQNCAVSPCSPLSFFTYKLKPLL